MGHARCICLLSGSGGTAYPRQEQQLLHTNPNSSEHVTAPERPPSEPLSLPSPTSDGSSSHPSSPSVSSLSAGKWECEATNLPSVDWISLVQQASWRMQVSQSTPSQHRHSSSAIISTPGSWTTTTSTTTSIGAGSAPGGAYGLWRAMKSS